MVYGESLSANKGQSATNIGGIMKRLNKQEFIDKVREKYPEEPFEILEYSGTSKPGKYYCGLCKEKYELCRMGKLVSEERKHLCSHCWASQYTQEILDNFPNEKFDFVKLGYNKQNNKPTIVYKCKKCGQDTEKPFVEYKKYPTCIHCGKNAKRRTTEGLILALPQDFEPLEDYKGKDRKILFRHKECGFIFKTCPNNLVNGGTGCPKCNKKISKGERKIMNWLEANNIQFEKEKKFQWSGLRRYDFYLPNENLIIEYNGSQHYIDKGFFEKSCSEQQEIDKKKEEKAREKNIDYLVIPYTDFQEIENILAQRLSRKGVGDSVPSEMKNNPLG